MSIYGTMGRFGISVGDKIHQVTIQGVPPHIDNVGPNWDFLPPPVDPNGNVMRAVFFVLDNTEKGTERNGQEYVNPLLSMSGEDYLNIKFIDLISKLARRIGTQSMIEKTTAAGVEGFLIYSPYEGKHLFRVYDENKEFKDYHICAEDVEIRILGNSISLYESDDDDSCGKLDYNSRVLGKKPNPNMDTRSLGQIAYEADPRGGQQNWGKWEDVPDMIKDIHEEMANAVKEAVWERLPK